MSAVSNKMGSCPPTNERGLQQTSITGTTLALNDNFVNATSGSAYAVRFSAPVGQSSAALTVYAYMTTKTGSPTAITAGIWAGPSGVMDAQRPDTGAALATVAVDVSTQSNNTWTTFSISSVSLTAGATYWLVIYNATGTPASNNATYMTRGNTGNMGLARFPAWTTTNGFTTDPTVVSASSEAPVVLKFSDGSIIGSPYTVTTAHASNANDRGNRYTFDAATTVSGVILASTMLASSITAVKVYQGASEVASVTLDRSQINNAGAVYFSSSVSFAASSAYDVVCKYSGATVQGGYTDAGTSPPSDVTSCMPAGLQYVDGATPGSYTATNAATGIFLLIDNVPAAAGGSGAASYGFGS